MELEIGKKIQCPQCEWFFWVCRTCWRGQKYCSDACGDQGHREQRRAAQKKYASSPEVREDRKDYQRSYRLKKANEISDESQKTGVTDPTSPLPNLPINPSVLSIPVFKSTRVTLFFGKGDPRCQVCQIPLRMSD